jgi:hypothetical protein
MADVANARQALAKELTDTLFLGPQIGVATLSWTGKIRRMCQTERKFDHGSPKKVKTTL